MVTVTIEGRAGTPSVQLPPEHVALFTKELNFTKRHRRAGIGSPQRVASDCRILVDSKGRRTEYELYGRTILMQVSTRRSWQFYFGLLLLEWLATL
jgi:hypothetical protein